jgi:hypothetical protein
MSIILRVDGLLGKITGTSYGGQVNIGEQTSSIAGLLVEISLMMDSSVSKVRK